MISFNFLSKCSMVTIWSSFSLNIEISSDCEASILYCMNRLISKIKICVSEFINTLNWFVFYLCPLKLNLNSFLLYLLIFINIILFLLQKLKSKFIFIRSHLVSDLFQRYFHLYETLLQFRYLLLIGLPNE